MPGIVAIFYGMAPDLDVPLDSNVAEVDVRFVIGREGRRNWQFVALDERVRVFRPQGHGG
jgi:hypothetical protein